MQRRGEGPSCISFAARRASSFPPLFLAPVKGRWQNRLPGHSLWGCADECFADLGGRVLAERSALDLWGFLAEEEEEGEGSGTGTEEEAAAAGVGTWLEAGESVEEAWALRWARRS